MTQRHASEAAAAASPQGHVPFYLHDLGEPELAEVAAVLAGPMLTTGETVARFEREFAAYLGLRRAVGVTSCTAAIHLALLALGVGPGDEVITTPVTFIATATAILQAGAVPVFADVEPDTGNLDAAKLEAAITPRTKAIVPVHLYGQLCDMRAIRAIADRHGLVIVEDCAHCVVGTRDGVGPGQLGHAAAFSFYATKELTCGEGGAIATNDEAMADRLKLLRLHGMDKTAADRWTEGYRHWDMTSFGWKYNMDNIQAALLLPQLARLDRKWENRRALSRRYDERLAGIPGLTLPTHRPGVKHSYYVYPIFVDPARRDEVIAALQAADMFVAVQFRAIHLLTYFRETYGYQPGRFPEAERIGSMTICLPFFPGMAEGQVDAVAAVVRRALVE